MTVKTAGMSLNLVWITVSDFDKAVTYYTDVLGLEVVERVDEMGWAELKGEGGATLGICRTYEDMPAGANAVVTFSVDDIETTKKELGERGIIFEGEIVEIPGHVKMQLCRDPDGNQYQICQGLEA